MATLASEIVRISLEYMVLLLRGLAERLALRWVQKYISTFGGDPRKVTMYAIILFI
jgi:hypothetical protein